MKVPWIIKETIGAAMLLAAVIYLPVWITDQTAAKVMPFRPKPPNRQALNVSPSDPETRQAIVDAMAAQLHAIRQGAFKEAYGHASAGIRNTIPLTEFERMVRIRFKPMLDFEAVEISDVFDDGWQAIIRVRLSREGIPTAIYTYIMALENDRWTVGGVLPEENRQSRPSQPPAPSTASSSFPKRVGVESRLAPGRI